MYIDERHKKKFNKTFVIISSSQKASKIVYRTNAHHHGSVESVLNTLSLLCLHFFPLLLFSCCSTDKLMRGVDRRKPVLAFSVVVVTQ